MELKAVEIQLEKHLALECRAAFGIECLWFEAKIYQVNFLHKGIQHSHRIVQGYAVLRAVHTHLLPRLLFDKIHAASCFLYDVCTAFISLILSRE